MQTTIRFMTRKEFSKAILTLGWHGYYAGGGGLELDSEKNSFIVDFSNENRAVIENFLLNCGGFVVGEGVAHQLSNGKFVVSHAVGTSLMDCPTGTVTKLQGVQP